MKKIVVVDDAEFMRLALKTSLEKNGYEVVGEAENGLKGLELYKSKKPDIITLDITMPIMEGIATLKEIMKYDPKANVIMVSALGQETKVRQAVILGAKSFIVKPFGDETLLKAISIF